MYPIFIKRLFDFIIALTFLLLILPILFIASVILLINNKGTPFFYQKRPGKDEKIFTIIKFKTMNNNRDDKGDLLSDSQRLTKVGKFVRKASIDELPQIINVIKGEMSFIGPRPLLPEYLPLYNDFQKQRHKVRPGITGWAQINGRNTISWKQKFEYDVYYVNNISFALDTKIFFKTIKKVFLRSDINKAKEATMSRFKGNNHK